MAAKGRHAQKSHKGLAVTIVIILIIAILAVGGYLFRQEVVDVYNDLTGETTVTTVPLTTTTVPPTAPTTVTIDPTTKKVQTLLTDKMTTEEKVCQLFIVTPEELTKVDVATVAGDTTKKMLKNYPVGGMVYFEQNKEDDDAFEEMVTKTKSFAKTPLFIVEDGDKILKNNKFSESKNLIAAYAENGSKAVKEFSNGAQVLIMPKDLAKTVTYFTTAVNSGQVDKTALDNAVTAILKAKLDNGILKLPKN